MSRPYCQFPLCLLGYHGRSNGRRLLHILGYSAGEYGKKLWSRCSQEEQEYRRAHPPDWCTVNLKEDRHAQAVIGCEKLELIPEHIFSVAAHHAAATRFVEFWEFRHGPDAIVRIDVGWVLEALHETGISYEELCVLGAIYSKIGASKKAVRITQLEIWYRALGCKSKDVFKVQAGYLSDTELTKRRVRSIIECLHDRGFFARVTVFRRETYYSHRLRRTELAEEVFSKKIKRHLVKQARIAADADLTKRIQAERRKLAGPSATDTATNAPL